MTELGVRSDKAALPSGCTTRRRQSFLTLPGNMAQCGVSSHAVGRLPARPTSGPELVSGRRYRLMTGPTFFKQTLLATALAAAAICSAASQADAGYIQTNLVSDIAGLAILNDPNLANPWGVSRSATSPFWVSDQRTNVSTLYNVTSTGVTINPRVVTIPMTASGPPQGPTGQVSNIGGSNFLVGGNPASFIFTNLNGPFSAWNAGLGNNTAQIVKPSDGEIYTGLAINNSKTMLYAATSDEIAVLDGNFADKDLGPNAFKNPFPGLVPFNVQNINGEIYVTYALPTRAAQIAATEGEGGVAVFDENGNLIRTLINGSKLASPWGLALAPAGFGEFGGDLLGGNFSFAASEINAFDPLTGALLGTIPVDDGGNGAGGLWALIFGNGGNGGDPNTLYFSDGIAGETHGLFAAIAPVPEPSSLALIVAALGLGFVAYRRA